MAQEPHQDQAAPEPHDGASAGDVIAVILSVGWLIGAVAWFWLIPAGSAAGGDPLRFVMTLLAIFLPVAVIWVAASAARASRIMREESRRLQAAVDALRRTYLDDRAARKVEASLASAPAMEKQLSELASVAKATEEVLATFSSSRPRSAAKARPPAPPQEQQPTLALGTAADELAPPLAHADFIRALNFPENEGDEAGFAALRRALRDRSARQLIQASQDVLTLLSQDGIYMDDLRPDRARPEIWRRFAAGERGRAVAALGGIRDRSCLALTIGRMREDAVFRDAAHHFLRQFDKSLVTFEAEASDEEIGQMSETRTARAFMLMGRVTGAFD